MSKYLLLGFVYFVLWFFALLKRPEGGLSLGEVLSAACLMCLMCLVCVFFFKPIKTLVCHLLATKMDEQPECVQNDQQSECL